MADAPSRLDGVFANNDRQAIGTFQVAGLTGYNTEDAELFALGRKVYTRLQAFPVRVFRPLREAINVGCLFPYDPSLTAIVH
jgi:hypothetical protein